ncbi:MAG: hypothetical protein AMXMBFR59_19570 [Rhodanobacteraceae bacterium]
MSNGRGARLHDNTALYGEPWLIALDLRLDDKDRLILSAAPFDPDLLERDFLERFTAARAVRWNGAKRAVEAFEERRFAALVLSRRQVTVTSADAVPALMAAERDGCCERRNINSALTLADWWTAPSWGRYFA